LRKLEGEEKDEIYDKMERLRNQMRDNEK